MPDLKMRPVSDLGATDFALKLIFLKSVCTLYCGTPNLLLSFLPKIGVFSSSQKMISELSLFWKLFKSNLLLSELVPPTSLWAFFFPPLSSGFFFFRLKKQLRIDRLLVYWDFVYFCLTLLSFDLTLVDFWDFYSSLFFIRTLWDLFTTCDFASPDLLEFDCWSPSLILIIISLSPFGLFLSLNEKVTFRWASPTYVSTFKASSWAFLAKVTFLWDSLSCECSELDSGLKLSKLLLSSACFPSALVLQNVAILMASSQDF